MNTIHLIAAVLIAEAGGEARQPAPLQAVREVIATRSKLYHMPESKVVLARK